MTVKFTKIHPDVPTPKRAHPTDAGVDLTAWSADDCGAGRWVGSTVPYDGTLMVSTGVKVAIPEGYVGLLYVRSSLGVKRRLDLANGTGVIDADYRGEVKVCLRNTGRSPQFIRRGDRICQLVVVPVDLTDWVEVEQLDETVRGQGGFGSTGEK